MSLKKILLKLSELFDNSDNQSKKKQLKAIEKLLKKLEKKELKLEQKLALTHEKEKAEELKRELVIARAQFKKGKKVLDDLIKSLKD